MLSFTHDDHVKLLADLEPKYFPSMSDSDYKKYHIKKYLKSFLRLKTLMDDEIRSEVGFIETRDDDTTSDIIKNYVDNKGNHEEKEPYKQIKIFNFE
jgi:putative transposase